MEDLRECIRSLPMYGGFEGLSTFDAFTRQITHHLYTEVRDMREKNSKDESIAEHIANKYHFDESVISVLVKINVEKEEQAPEFEIKEKKLEKIRNPKTGRMIYKEGELFKDLVEQGWLDKSGNPLKEHTVRKIKNPKTGKSLTIGSNRFHKMVDEGWMDTSGRILKVVHPEMKTVIDVHDPSFADLVSQGIFKEDGTLIERL